MYRFDPYDKESQELRETWMSSSGNVASNNTLSFLCRSEELVEPQASALAKLCAYCVFSALEFQSNATPGQVNSRKRSRRDTEGEVQLHCSLPCSCS
jgi:hypothetical protein